MQDLAQQTMNRKFNFDTLNEDLFKADVSEFFVNLNSVICREYNFDKIHQIEMDNGRDLEREAELAEMDKKERKAIKVKEQKKLK